MTIVARGNKSNSTIRQTVSRVIQDYSSFSEGYRGTEDIFYSVEGIGNSIRGLNE